MKQYGEMILKTVQTMKTRMEKWKKEKENNASFKLNALFCSTVKRDTETLRVA